MPSLGLAALCCQVLLMANFQHFFTTSAEPQYKREGDVVIGVVMPVRRMNKLRANDFDATVACGPMIPNWVMQVTQFVRIVDQINADSSKLGGLKLGFEIVDSCSLPSIALSRSLPWATSRSSSATNASIMPFIIGPRKSRISVPLAELFQLVNMPVIDFGATFPELSDKRRYQLYARTSPSDVYQARAITALVDYLFNWTCVHLVYSSGFYGEYGAEEMRIALNARGICIVTYSKVPEQNDEHYIEKNIVKAIHEKPSVAGIVCFCEEVTVVSLLKAILSAQKPYNEKGENAPKFVVIASESFGTSPSQLQDLGSVAAGMVTTALVSNDKTSDFKSWFSKNAEQVIQKSQSDNPFLKAYIESRCQSAGAPAKCTKDKFELDDVPYTHFLESLATALYAGVDALKSVLATHCRGMLSNKCSGDLLKFAQVLQNGSDVYSFILNATVDNQKVFDSHGDYAHPHYQFYSFRQQSKSFAPFASYQKGKLVYAPSDVDQYRRWPSSGDPIRSSCDRNSTTCLGSNASSCPYSPGVQVNNNTETSCWTTLQPIFIPLISIVAILIAIIVIAVVVFLWKRRREMQKQQQRTNRQEEEIQKDLFGRPIIAVGERYRRESATNNIRRCYEYS